MNKTECGLQNQTSAERSRCWLKRRAQLSCQFASVSPLIIITVLFPASLLRLHVVALRRLRSPKFHCSQSHCSVYIAGCVLFGCFFFFSFSRLVHLPHAPSSALAVGTRLQRNTELFWEAAGSVKWGSEVTQLGLWFLPACKALKKRLYLDPRLPRRLAASTELPSDKTEVGGTSQPGGNTTAALTTSVFA